MRSDSVDRKLDRLLADQKNKTESGQLMTNKQVAKMLGVSQSTLQNYRDRGMITFSQIRRKIFYRQEDLLSFLNKNKIDGYARKK